MNDIRRVLNQAARRLWITDTLRTVTIMLIIGLTGLLAARIVERIFGFAFPWRTVFYATGAAVVVIAIAWSYVARKRAIAVATILDERAGLRETLSTALYMSQSDDPWAKAVLETALTRAKTVKVGDAIPIESPRLWPVPIAAGLAFALVWYFFPELDVLKVKATKVAQQQKAAEVVQVKTDLEQKQDKIKKALEQAKVEFLDQKGDDPDAKDKKPEANDPDAMRREAVKRLTDLAEKLEAQKEGEKAAQAEAMKEAMKQLKQPGDGPLNEFSRALSRGDFNKANEQLKQLQEKLADANTSPQEKAKAKEQMENLSKQLKKLADNQGELAKQLQNAGLDKKTAEEMAKNAMSNNPEAMKKALEQAKNLSEEQKKQLMEMAKAAHKAGEDAGKMGESMSKMAQGMTQEGLQQEGQEGMQEMSKELSQSEMLQEDMQNLDAALDEAKAQLAELGNCLGGSCDKPGQGNGEGKVGGWKPGESQGKKGSGSGNPGQSEGAPSPEAVAADFQLEKKKANTQTQGGPIIGTRLVYGEQVKGESSAQYSEAVEASTKEATEAVESMQVPREYHDAVKHYFGTLQAKVKKEAAQKPAEKPADKPAEKK